MKRKIIIVNEQDEQIGLKKRGTLNIEDIYRVSALVIFNKQGKFLMAQRSFSKKHSPGVWNTSVAGTNDEGESYISNIIKEAEEELGILIHEDKLKEMFILRHNDKYNYFCTRYTITLNITEEECKLQKEEVERVQFLDLCELRKNISTDPDMYSQSFYKIIEKIKASE